MNERPPFDRRPFPRPQAMSPAGAMIERAKLREFLDMTRARARSAQAGEPYDKFAEAPFAGLVVAHGKDACPLADAPAAGCWACLISLCKTFVMTTDPGRRGQLAPGLEGLARGFEAMLDAAQADASDVWRRRIPENDR